MKTKQNIKAHDNSQELSDEKIKGLLKKLGVTARSIANEWGLYPQQIWAAINTNEQPTLRKRLVERLLELKATRKSVKK